MSLERKIQELVEQESLGVLGEFRKLQERADEVVGILRRNRLPIDSKLLGITEVGREPKPKVVSKVEVPDKKEPPTQKIVKPVDPRTIKAERELKNQANVIYDALLTKPRISSELADAFGLSNFKIGKILKYLKDQNKIGHRTEVWQGSTVWYAFAAPVELVVLEKYVKTLDKGKQIVFDDLYSHFKIDRRSTLGLEAQLRALAAKGQIVRRGGLYYNEPGTLSKTNGNGEGRKATFSGGGVATSGDLLSSNKDVRALVSAARSAGATVESGGKHIIIRYNGKTTTIGRTPGVAGLKQDRSNLKAMGLNV